MLSDGGPRGLADEPRWTGRLGVLLLLASKSEGKASDIMTDAIFAGCAENYVDLLWC